MTVAYNSDLQSVGIFGVFWKMLFRWRGSIYKLVLPDMAIYILFYYLLNLPYRYAMNAQSRALFQQVVTYCHNMSSSIPMSFVLGFYVTIVVQRWWAQYLCMPWPDGVAVYVSANIQGTDDRGRLIRRTIMRYINLCFVVMMSEVCTQVRRRFPTLDHFVEAGILTDSEKRIFETLEKKTPHMKYWMPTVWAGSIVVKARKEGRIRDDFAVKTLIDSINQFRGGVGGILNYDWISVPLVYTQTVTLAVYTFFMAEMMGRQFVMGDGNVDLFVPFFSFVSFFFYMGWLRVAETLCNPFGDDDDDFEINWLIDRNLQVSYLIVDEMHDDHPELVRDQYWEEVIPKDLPYTEEAEQYRKDTSEGSAAGFSTSKHTTTVSPPSDDLMRTVSPASKIEQNMTQFMQIPRESRHGDPVSSKSMFQAKSRPSKSVPVAHSSLPIMMKRLPSSATKNITSISRGLKSQNSLACAMRTFAKRFTNRVMEGAVTIVEDPADDKDKKLPSDLSGNGTNGTRRNVEHRDETNRWWSSDDRNAPPVSVLMPPPISEMSHMSMHSAGVAEEAVNTQQETVEQIVIDKEAQKFIPGEYTFLLTPMEDEVQSAGLEAPIPDSKEPLFVPYTQSILQTTQSPMNLSVVMQESYRSLGEPTDSEPTLREGMLSKILIAFLDAMDAIATTFSGPEPPEPPIPPSDPLDELSSPPDHASEDDVSQESEIAGLRTRSVSAVPVSSTAEIPIQSASDPVFTKRKTKYNDGKRTDPKIRDREQIDRNFDTLREAVIHEESSSSVHLAQTPETSSVSVLKHVNFAVPSEFEENPSPDSVQEAGSDQPLAAQPSSDSNTVQRTDTKGFSQGVSSNGQLWGQFFAHPSPQARSSHQTLATRDDPLHISGHQDSRPSLDSPDSEASATAPKVSTSDHASHLSDLLDLWAVPQEEADIDEASTMNEESGGSLDSRNDGTSAQSDPT